jgi:hypothetical protein
MKGTPEDTLGTPPEDTPEYTPGGHLWRQPWRTPLEDTLEDHQPESPQGVLNGPLGGVL